MKSTKILPLFPILYHGSVLYLALPHSRKKTIFLFVTFLVEGLMRGLYNVLCLQLSLAPQLGEEVSNENRRLTLAFFFFHSWYR